MQLSDSFHSNSKIAHRTVIPLLIFLSVGIQSEHAKADVIDLTVGTNQVCLLDDTNHLKCRTHVFHDRLIPPEDTPELVSIAAGDAHLCGLTTSGDVHCFGDNDFGQTSHDAETQGNRYKDINAGSNHTCATRLSGMQIDCWGGESGQLTSTLSEYLTSLNYRGQLQNIRQTVMGNNEICWISEMTSNRNNFFCWTHGRDFYQILDAGRILSASTDGTYYCSIVSDGGVVCLEDIGWRRLLQSTSFGLSEPYSKVAVSGSVVCVIDSSGRLDCDTSILEGESAGLYEERNAAAINDQVSLLADKRFTHLEPFPAYFNNGGVGFCLADTQDNLHCIGDRYATFNEPTPSADWIDSGFASDDYNDSLLTITNIDVYSSNIVELFWEPSIDYLEYSHIEIYRDGTLLTNTTNADSYFDNTLEEGTTYTYKIREVHIDSTIGEFSEEYVVRTPSNSNPFVENPNAPGDCTGGTLPPPIALQVIRYGVNSGEIFWQPNMYDLTVGVAFNLFVNGIQINNDAFDNNGSFYLSGSDLYDDTYRYSLNAVDSCGRVSDVSNVVAVN